MKRIYSLPLLLVLLFLLDFHAFAQKDLVISGGNTVSSIVCANRRVFVWGNNAGNQLGTVSTADPITVPTEVNIPGNKDIQQVNSGSGSHFVAVDCDGWVWAWGANPHGQVGNPAATDPQTGPIRVVADPEVAVTHRDAADNNYLINADVVYSGTSNSFAILDNGRLVSWGKNDFSGGAFCAGCQQGQLGHGTDVNTNVAKYVRTNAATPLENVVQVFVGDNVAYALVDDNGDGVGTVYSWGQGENGTLGRNAAGTGNPSAAAQVQSSYALPVHYDAASGKPGPMNDIQAISAGDVFGIALDVDGYVWTWGNGGWNNATGNTTVNYTGSDPRRVIAGNTVGASNDGSYLLAKAIGGGQGYGMAVTADGKPVSWGGTGGCADGGMTGTGTTTAGIEPTYIEYGAGLVHDNVISINRGDTWGFYGTSDNDYYAWGCNTYGQLGIGNTTNQVRATPIVPPTGCGLRDPAPFVDLSPGDTTVCEASFTSLTLNSGFFIDPSIETEYEIRWIRDGTTQVTGTAANALTYNATQPGTYRVEIEYTGSNAGCQVYDTEIEEMTIGAYAVGMSDPGGLEYCGSDATVNVTSTHASDNPVYEWYETAVSTTVLGTTIGNASTTIDVSGIAGAGTKTVYVEEVSDFSGLVFEQNESCDPNFNAGNGNVFLNNNQNTNPNYQTRFEAFENITLTSVDIVFVTKVYTVGNSLAGDINFTIYGGKTLGNGDVVADAASPIGTFSHSFTRTRGAGDPEEVVHQVTVPVNITVPGSAAGTAFFLSPSNVPHTNQTGNGDVRLGIADCAQSVPLVDNINGNIVHMTGMSQNFSNNQTGGNLKGGHFFNVNFSSGPGYCNRVPVTLTENCPCTAPGSSPSITGGGPFCDAGTLSGSIVGGAGNRYQWFLDGVAIGTPAAVVGSPAGVTSPSVTTTGVLTIRVADSDANLLNTGCYDLSGGETITINTTPSAPVASDDEYCLNEAATALTATGSNLLWYTVSTGGTGSASETPSTATATTLNYWVSQTVNGCESPRATQDVVIHALPTVTASSNVAGDEICDGGSVTLTGSGATTYSWDNGVTDGVSFSPGTTTTYTVTGEDGNTCENTDMITITVNPLPTVTANSNPASGEICAGDNVTLTGGGANSYTWDNGVTDGVAFSPTTTTTYTVTGTDVNTCVDTETITVTVHETPVANISIDNNTICSGDNATLTVTVTAGASPFIITYNGTGGGDVTTAAVTSPHDITVSTEETFTLVSVQDANTCTTTAPSPDLTGSETVTFDPDVAGGVTLSCDPSAADDDFVITVTLTAGDFNSDVVTGDNGVTFADLGGGVWEATGINESLTIDVSATDGNACNTLALDNNNLVCSCPEVATISGDASICEEGTPTSTDLTVAFTGGGAAQVYNFEIFNSTTSTVVQTVTAHNGDSDYILAVNGPGVYQVRNVTGSCAGSGVGSATVDYHPSPAAVISGGGTICDNATATTDVFINFTNTTTPYSFTFNGTSTGSISETGQTGTQYTLNTDVDEFFDWSGASVVTDANGCTAKAADLTGDATIDNFNDPDTTSVTLTCDPANPVLPPGQFNYFITVEVTPGSGTPSVLSGEAATFTNTSGNTWVSDMIDENVLSSFILSDENACNPITVTDLQRICSCPETATLGIEASSQNQICEEGTPTTADLEIVFSGGTTYDFDVIRVSDNFVVASETGYNGATNYIFDVDQADDYRITNFQGACPGNPGNDLTISYHPSPVATISGGGTICDDGSDVATVTIDVTTGTPNYTIDYLGSGIGGAQQETANTGQHIFTSSDDETWTLTGVTDANGCTAKAADLTGSAMIDYHAEPVVDLLSIDYDCPNGQAVPHDYTVTFDVSGGQGSGNYDFQEFLANTNTPAGYTATEAGGVVTISGVPENITLDVSVTDGNGCNPVLVEDLKYICSCPTTAELTAVGATTVCDGDNVTLRLTTQGGTGDYTFDIVNSVGTTVESAANFSTFPHNFTVNAEETYSIKTFYDNGESCEAGKMGNIPVIVNPLPTATLQATGATNICAGDATDPFEIVFANGTAPFTYEYAIGGTGQGLLVEPTTTATIAGATSGPLTYTMLSVEDDNACVGTVSGQIDVDEYERPEATISMVGGDICLGDAAPAISVEFTAGAAPYSFKYDDGVNPEFGPVSTSTTPHSITAAATVGNYNYTLTELSDANCPAIASGISGNGTVVYSVHALPTFSSVSATDDTICSDGSDPVTMFVTFTGAAPITYAYTQPAMTRTTSTTGGTLNGQHISAEEGLHTFDSIVDANTCKAANSGSYMIYHSDPIILTITGEDTVCREDGDVFLTVLNHGNNPILWSTDETIDMIEATQTGAYWVQVDDATCPATSTRVTSGIVKIDEEPNVNISGNENSVVVFEGDPITLTGLVSNVADGLLWSSDNGLNGLVDQTDTVTSFVSIEGGIYNYTLTGFNGECQNDASINVIVIEPVEIPNAFTPNGDGDNEVWDIRGMSTYNEAVVKIFNRWGNLVYEKFGTYEQWDGTQMNKGKELPVGTYYYVIDLGIEIPGGGLQERSGNVSIIR